MKTCPLFPSLLIALALILTACGGGDGGGGIDENADIDGDGLINLTDVDDDNDGFIEIKSLEQLDWMRNDLAGTSLTDHIGTEMMDGCPNTGCYGYELAADLDFDTNGDGLMNANDTYYDYDNDGQNNGWLPIGTLLTPFQASFEGNGHHINNLYIDRRVTDAETTGLYIGLFGYIDGFQITPGVEIRNLILEGPLMGVTGNRYVGGLTGYAIWFVSIINTTATGSVTDEAGTVGGLIGRALKGITIDRCSASGSVTGNGNATGGLVGAIREMVTISNSSASTSVNGILSNGGLVGTALDNITISNSSASGNVTGRNGNGGLVGVASWGVTIANSSASGNVTSNNNFGEFTGGLVGQAQAANPAIPANLTYIRISNSYATGAIAGSDFTGGLVGGFNFDNPAIYSCAPATPCRITSSFATGAVEGNNYVGGLVGISYHVELDNTFATGAVSNSNQYVGGLIGDANDGTTISHSFVANTVAGALDVGALIGFSDGVTYTDNFFANDRGQVNALGTNHNNASDVNPAGTTGAPLADLQTATSAGESVNGQNLFTNWGSEWDFGSNTQLPGLLIGRTVYRDGDANGVLD